MPNDTEQILPEEKPMVASNSTRADCMVALVELSLAAGQTAKEMFGGGGGGFPNRWGGGRGRTRMVVPASGNETI